MYYLLKNKFFKYIIFLLLAIISLRVNCEILKESFEKYNLFMDTEDVTKTSDGVFFNWLYDYKKSQTIDGVTFLSQVILFEVDCKSNKLRPVESVRFSGNLADGKIVKKSSAILEWDPLNFDGKFSVLNRICLGNSSTKPSAELVEKVEAANYRDVKEALLDGSQSIGKTIQFIVYFIELGIMPGEVPNMLVKARDNETSLDLWQINFDKIFNDSVQGLKKNDILKIKCKIDKLSSIVSKCGLISLQVISK